MIHSPSKKEDSPQLLKWLLVDCTGLILPAFHEEKKKSGMKTKKHQQLKDVRLFLISKRCENLKATPLLGKDRH